MDQLSIQILLKPTSRQNRVRNEKSLTVELKNSDVAEAKAPEKQSNAMEKCIFSDGKYGKSIGLVTLWSISKPTNLDAEIHN